MWLGIALLIILGSGCVTALLLLRLGIPRRTAVVAGIATGLIEGVLLVTWFLVVFGECLAENPDPPPPPSYPWSPRREFCDVTSASQLGMLAFFLLPPLLIGGGALLRARGRQVVGVAISAACLAVPLLPPIYLEVFVKSLPYYRLDSYPVLHEPLLRPAQVGIPARACYAYGVAFGLQTTTATTRTCIEFAPTPEAVSLTTEYDEGRTIYDLNLVAHHLTERGLPVEEGSTGVDGLTVSRVYELPDTDARQGSQVVE